MDVDQALEAIRDLLQHVADAMRRPGVLELGLGSNSYKDVRDEYHKARAEYDKWRDAIWDAKRRLHASGFEMSDAWVQAEIVYPVGGGRRRPHGYWLALRHDELDVLEKLKAELLLAARRLQLEQGVKGKGNDHDHSDSGANGAVKGKRINARMLETIMTTPDTRGWTARKWAEHLKCSKSSVIATGAWKALKTHRDTLRAERATAKRRRPKGSELRRD